MSRLQVLVASPTPVFPATDGGRLHTMRHLAACADDVDYHLLAMVTPAERAAWDADAHDAFFATVSVVDRPPTMPDMGAAAAWRHFWFHVRRGLPLISVSYYSPAAVDAARAIVATRDIDLIETLNTHMSFVHRFVPEVPAILVSQNIEGDLHPFWAGQRSIPARAMWKALGALSRRTTRRAELGNSLGFDDRLYITPDDARRASPPNEILGVTVPIESTERSFSPERFDLLTIGSFDWPPNAEGVRWLLEEVWPMVTTPMARLNIVGANPPSDVVAAAGDRVEVLGYVQDAAAWRRQADALLVPILTGGGARVKVVEALGAGLPVITTSKGGEGLSLVDGETALIADGASDFAEAIDRLAGSIQRRRQLSGLGLQMARERHSAATAASIKRASYERALGRPLDAP